MSFLQHSSSNSTVEFRPRGEYYNFGLATIPLNYDSVVAVAAPPAATIFRTRSKLLSSNAFCRCFVIVVVVAAAAAAAADGPLEPVDPFPDDAEEAVVVLGGEEAEEEEAAAAVAAPSI